MNKVALTIVVFLTTLACNAQEHLTFMGIPLDCPIDTFCSKLISTKGLVEAEMEDFLQRPNMQTKKLTGDFYGLKDCFFYIRKHERLKNVSSVEVDFPHLESISKEDADRIISLHDKEYGSHKIDSAWGVWCTWEPTKGKVILDLSGAYFNAVYTDTTELFIEKVIQEEKERKIERQTTKEICGIPFGSSYEKTKEVLENKYGASSYLSDKTQIVYDNKNYAGISFDQILFLFQSDGYKSYLNGCVFILEASSLNDAKDKQERLYRKLNVKYDMKDGVDKDGNKYYYGGYSPIGSWDSGFIIDIIKYDNRSRIPYSARLMYGRYNYVKEEF